MAHRGDGPGVYLRELCLSGLQRLPQFVIEDTKLGNLPRDPLFRGFEAQHPPSGLQVLHKTLPVPDRTTDMEFVVDDSPAPLGMAAQLGVGPELALGEPC